MRKKKLILKPEIVLLSGVSVCTVGAQVAPSLTAADKQVAQQVEKALRSRYTSPNKSLRLVVQPTTRSREGYFSEIIIEGKPVQIKRLRVSEFSLRAKDVRVKLESLKKNKVHTSQAKTRFRAVVSENDLTHMFAQGKHTRAMGLKAKYIKDATHGDVLQVAGNWKWSWFNGPVTGVGKLRITKDNQVFADIISLKLNGAEVPGFVKNKFSDSLNPVLDYNDVPFQPRFNQLKVQGSRAILTG
jgi:hypothetical protein